MDRNEQSEPIMDGSTEATDEEKRAGLAEQVESDHRGAGDDGSDDFAERAQEIGLAQTAEADEDGTQFVSREPA
jgi:hypothetical protein